MSQAEERELAGRIAVNARKLDRMLGDLLDVDRLARGVIAPRREPTDIAELIERVLREADVRGRTIEVDAEGVVAAVDGPKLERIVENLVVNAERHTAAGGGIWIRAAHTPDGLLISLDDEGEGVPDELRQAIFEPFQRFDNRKVGVGLGLAVAKGFTEAMGGGIVAADTPGGGLTVRITLPVASRGAESMQGADS